MSDFPAAGILGFYQGEPLVGKTLARAISTCGWPFFASGEKSGILQGEPLVKHYLYNAGVLQQLRTILQLMVILDTTKHT